MKYSFILVVIIISLIIYMFFGHNGLLKYNELVRIKASYEMRLGDMEKKLEKLQDELRLIKNDKAYLEMLIKQDLNLVKPDEDLYILEDGKIHSNRTDTKDKKSD